MKTASDLIGLTLYSRQRIPLLQWGSPDAPVLRYVEPKQRIGVLRSWVRKQSHGGLWFWEFDDNVRGELKTFYVAHIPETLDMPQLRHDMLNRDEATRRRQLEWYQRVMENTRDVIASSSSSLFHGALLLGGLYVIGRAITR